MPAKIDLIQQVQSVLQVVNGGTGLDYVPLYAQILFADAEIPGGVQNSSNTIFAWEFAPTPALSLICSKNGSVLRQGVGKDYTLVGNVMTLTVAPAPSDMVQGWYRYLTSTPPPPVPNEDELQQRWVDWRVRFRPEDIESK